MADNEQASQPRPPLGKRLRDNPAYPVAYMFCVTFVFTGIIVGVSRATRERVEQNQQIMRERAILMATLPDEVDYRTPSPVVHQTFLERVTPPGEGEVLYRVMENDTLRAYALPLDGQGFWDDIRGMLGLEPDKETIVSIAFHVQAETPGLGAEITQPHFREQFRGKKLAPDDKPLEVVSPAEETTEHSVHAITGATQTSIRVERIINASVRAWREQKTQDEEGPE